MPDDETDLRRVIDRMIGRILEDPVSLDLLQKMQAYGSPEKAAMIEASRRLRDGGETSLMVPRTSGNPPLEAEAVPE